MHELEEKARWRGKTHHTNIFLGYSGHGTSINGRLNITLPTPITEEKYMQKCESLAGAFKKLPIDDDDLDKFKELSEKMGGKFEKGIVESGNEKGNHKFFISSKFKNEEVKKQMTEVLAKI